MTTSSALQRREALRESLPATVDLLRQRRACEVEESVIDDYVTLNWLEWNGGSLRLTTVGSNVCAQLKAQVR